MLKTRNLFAGLFLLSILLVACSAPAAPAQEGVSEDELATSVALTVDASLSEQAPAPTLEQSPTPSDTALPSETPTPSDTPTPSLTPTPSTPIVEVSTATNCRSGPGTAYVSVGVLNVDESAEVVGRTSDPEYAVIENPDAAGDCWLWLQFATVSASTEHLPLVDTPPTPTPSLTPTPSVVWADTWKIWVGPVPLTQYTMTLTRDGNSITGTFAAGGGNTVTVNGTLSSDFTYASGTWSSTAGGSGTFEWQRKKNINQFIGNIDGGAAEWCGAKSGASQPSPCLGP